MLTAVRMVSCQTFILFGRRHSSEAPPRQLLDDFALDDDRERDGRQLRATLDFYASL